MIVQSPLHRRLHAGQRATATRVRRVLAVHFGREDRWAADELALLGDTIEFAVSLSIEALGSRAPLPADFLDSCRHVAVAAARHRCPPAVVRRGPDLVASTLQAELWSRAEPGDHLELAAHSGFMVGQLALVRTHVLAGYVDQLRRDGFAPATGRSVAKALVEGRATPDLLRAAGHPPAARYRVLVVRADPGTDAALVVDDALRRRVGGLRCELDDDVVVIEGVDGPPTRDEGPDGVSGLLRDDPRLARSAIVVEAATRLADVPAAVATARGLLPLVLRLGRTGRLTTRHDLVLESRLLGDAQMARRLSEVVRVLDTERELIRTLQTLYLNDLDRTRTARELGIARRTLSYRVQRIRELTGLNPTGTRAVQVLGPGVAVLRARGAEAAPAPAGASAADRAGPARSRP